MLLGATDSMELVFAEVRYENDRFATSFNVVTPIEVTEELIAERVESLLECYDKETLYDLCCRYECAPNELAEEYANDVTVEDLLDTSLYTDYYDIVGHDTIYFESTSCGQCGDDYEVTIPYQSMELVEKVYDYWHKFHLCGLTEDKVEDIFRDITSSIDSAQNGCDWIENWLETVVYPM